MRKVDHITKQLSCAIRMQHSCSQEFLLSCLSFRCIPQALNKSNPAWYQRYFQSKSFSGPSSGNIFRVAGKRKILCLPFFQSSAHNIDALTLPSFEGEKRPTKVIAFHKSPFFPFFWTIRSFHLLEASLPLPPSLQFISLSVLSLTLPFSSTPL